MNSPFFGFQAIAKASSAGFCRRFMTGLREACVLSVAIAATAVSAWSDTSSLIRVDGKAHRLMGGEDLTKAGGAHYAQIATLAYRQVVAACGLAADANGQPLYFTRENTNIAPNPKTQSS